MAIIATSGEHLSTVVYHPELMRELEADQYGMNVSNCASDFGCPLSFFRVVV